MKIYTNCNHLRLEMYKSNCNIFMIRNYCYNFIIRKINAPINNEISPTHLLL